MRGMAGLEVKLRHKANWPVLILPDDSPQFYANLVGYEGRELVISSRNAFRPGTKGLMIASGHTGSMIFQVKFYATFQTQIFFKHGVRALFRVDEFLADSENTMRKAGRELPRIRLLP